jgi:hypothetical protein
MTDEGQGYPPPGDPSAGNQSAQYPAQPGYEQPYPQHPPYPGQGGYGAGPAETAVLVLPAGDPPAGSGAARGGRKPRYGAIGAAIAVVLAVGGYFVFSAGSSASASPATAVKQLFEAAENHDVAAAKHVLCKDDVAHGMQNAFGGQARIVTYTVGATSTENGVTTVTVRSTSTLDPQPVTEHIPVVKEDGSWKACLSSQGASVRAAGAPTGASAPGRPSAASRPTRRSRPAQTGLPAEPGPDQIIHRPGAAARPRTSAHPSRPVSAPPGGPSICAGATTGLGAAEIYVGAAQAGLTTYAQSCVSADRVPLALTKSLSGKKFGPRTNDPNAGQFVFETSGGGSRVTVATAKLSDGHYYVTGARVG